MSDTQTDLVKVRILTETHEHEDKPVAKGTVLEVSPRTATQLVKVEAAELVSGSAASMETEGLPGGAE